MTQSPRQTTNHWQYDVSPAALAFATRITQSQFEDVYCFAYLIDQVAREARENERKRIFSMSFSELFREFWKGRRLYNASESSNNAK